MKCRHRNDSAWAGAVIMPATSLLTLNEVNDPRPGTTTSMSINVNVSWLGRQTQDEAANRRCGARTPRPSTPARPGVATLHQVTMPSQHRVRADQTTQGPGLLNAGVCADQLVAQRPHNRPNHEPVHPHQSVRVVLDEPHRQAQSHGADGEQ